MLTFPKSGLRWKFYFQSIAKITNMKERHPYDIGEKMWESGFLDQSKYSEDRKCKEMNRTESMHRSRNPSPQIPGRHLRERRHYCRGYNLSRELWHAFDLGGEENTLPSHLRPWRTSPHSISPQWSQKAGALYEWTKRAWGRIWKSSKVAEAVKIVMLKSKLNEYPDL